MTCSDESDIDELERTIRDQWRVPLDSRQKCASSKNGKKLIATARARSRQPEVVLKKAATRSQLARKHVPVTLAPIGKKGKE
jgi:hypothetical protein